MNDEPTFAGRPEPSPVVTQFRTRGTTAERTEVELSDGRIFTIATEAILSLGLSRDTPLDAQMEARLVEADVRFRIRDTVLRALSRRAHSRRELMDRLYRKEFPGRLIQETLDRLEEIGLVDDRAFAEAYVRDRLRLRPRGRRALRAELAKKGVRADAEPAIEAVFEAQEVDDRAIAVEVAEGWLRRQRDKIIADLDAGPRTKSGQRALRRFLGYMARRGFSSGIARDALDTARGRQ